MSKELKQLKIFSLFAFIVFVSLIAILLFFADDKEVIVGEENIGNIDIYKEIPIEGWKNGWLTSPEYDGDNMPVNALVLAQNIEFDVKTSIAPRRGTLVLGTENSNTYPIKSLHTSKALDGRELLIRTSTTTMEWFNDDDDTWDILDTGYTNGLEFSFADGMTSSETANYTYFANNSQTLRRFRVAFGSVSTNSSTAITLNSVSGFDSADDIGFNTSGGTVTVNSSDYTYTGLSGWVLTGLTGLPTFSENEGVIHTVETTGFTSPPSSGKALVIKDQRLYVAYQNSVYCSKIDDFVDFSYSSPRVASEGEVVIFPEGGAEIKALGIRPNYVAVFKKDYIGSLKFQDFSSDLSDIPVVDTIDIEPNIGASSQKAVDNKSNSVIYSNKELGMSEISRASQETFDSINKLTMRIKPTVEDYDFSDSAIIYFDNKILNSTKDNEDFNNKIVIYDVVYDRLTEFSGLNASVFEIYNDKLYYGDSINQNVYQMFYSEYTDNALPYITEAKTKWFNFGYPANWKEIGYIFVSGWITSNTDIDFTIYLDEGGKLSEATYEIEGDGDYVAEDDSSGFGINPFGLVNFSNVEGSSDNLKHFAGFINTADLTQYKFRNIQAGIKTSGKDQNYRIDKIIFYANVLPREYGQDDLLINN